MQECVRASLRGARNRARSRYLSCIQYMYMQLVGTYSRPAAAGSCSLCCRRPLPAAVYVMMRHPISGRLGGALRVTMCTHAPRPCNHHVLC